MRARLAALLWIVSLMLGGAGCTRMVPPDTDPRPNQRIRVQVWEPREFRLEVDGQSVVHPVLRSVSGPMEWMRGDTVHLRVWSATVADGQTWKPPLRARATVVLDGTTNLMVAALDTRASASALGATTSVAVVGLLVLLTFAAVFATGSEST